jgi:hypothetical protein
MVPAQLRAITSLVSNSLENIKNGQSTLTDAATGLLTKGYVAAREAGADQGQISQHSAQVRHLQSGINSLAAPIIARGIKYAEPFTIGMVIAPAPVPVGTVVLLGKDPMIEAETASIALDAISIEAAQRAIAATEAAMTRTTAACARLFVLAGNYSRMASQTAQIHNSLDAVLGRWQSLENDFAEVVLATRSEGPNAALCVVSAVEEDLDCAVTEWKAIEAGSFAMNELRVNDATLRLGISSSAVRASLAGARTMPILDFYNQRGTSAAA